MDPSSPFAAPSTLPFSFAHFAASRDGLPARGGTVDPLEAVARVRGRAPRTEPLLRCRGKVG
jgi:Zn-dependent oligopeptidase